MFQAVKLLYCPVHEGEIDLCDLACWPARSEMGYIHRQLQMYWRERSRGVLAYKHTYGPQKQRRTPHYIEINRLAS